MMYILLVKRLESSWFSFHSTVGKILTHHQNVLDKINRYQEGQEDTTIEDVGSQELFEPEELNSFEEEFTLGKKRIITLTEIDRAGNLNNFKDDLKKDIEALDLLYRNLNRFSDDLVKEVKQPVNHQSNDDKLESLIDQINAKRKSGKNSNNQKVIIFTVFKDTAFYLFDQLSGRGFKDLAVVSGSVSKTDKSEHETKLFEPILERFAPYTKLFNEKEWGFIPSSPDLSKDLEYKEWIEWLSDNDKKTYELIKNPIDILISTDVLSEGQNLQDSDMVINYDIHWNPVRIIQRMGRIDRLGSPNKEIFGINYWPSENINIYLNLKGRIEQRMALMKLAGSEVQLEFSDSFKEMATDAEFENKMNEKMLMQMQTSWDEIEAHEAGLGFDNLSLEDFRQDLLEELQQDEKFYKRMPKGVYTGFNAKRSVCKENGIIALLGFPAKPPKTLDHEYQIFDLIYINNDGEQVLLNQKEVLEALSQHKEEVRYVPNSIERGEESAINDLVLSLKKWLDFQTTEEEIQDDGTIKRRAGSKTKDILSKLKTGDSTALSRVKQNISVSEKYKLQNFDLITWFLVN